MTVQTTTNIAVLSGNGSTTIFPFSFKVLNEDHLTVQRRDATTLVVNKTYTSGEYTVAGIGEDAGSITISGTPVAAGQQVVITRTVPYTQDADIVNQGGFYPETVEEQLDLMVMQTQQVTEQIDRAVKVLPGEGEVFLPSVESRKSRFLAFDETTGEPLAGPLLDSIGPISTAIASIDAVGGAIADVEIVAANIADVSLVADDITDVTTCADNIAAIVAAPGHASTAAAQAALAASSALDAADAAAALDGALAVAPGSVNYFPLARDQTTGEDLLWFTKGRLDGAGLGPYMRATLATQMVADKTIVPQVAVPSRGSRALFTDGRTLKAWKRKRAKIQAGLAAVARVAVVGDSWAAFGAGAGAIRDLLYADLGLSSPSAGMGWIPVYPQLNCGTLGSTVSYSKVHFTEEGNPAGFGVEPWNPPALSRGCGPDGLAMRATSTFATAQWTGVLGTNINIYYWDGDGTFRYRVDSGSWTTVVCGNTSAHAKIALSGLANTTHTIDIDLTGNTGTVCLHGLQAWNAGVTSGILFYKMGNSGIQGRHTSAWPSASCSYWNTELALDAVVCLLGINDYNNQSDPVFYKLGLSTMLSAHSGAKIVVAQPAAGVTPTLVYGAAIVPQTSYRDALLEAAASNGWEAYNMYDDWDSYSVENTGGAWSDTLHIYPQASATTDSTGSARRLANALCDNLFFR